MEERRVSQEGRSAGGQTAPRSHFQACGCGIDGALGISEGVVAGTPRGSPGEGTLAGAGAGTPSGSDGGVSEGPGG